MSYRPERPMAPANGSGTAQAAAGRPDRRPCPRLRTRCTGAGCSLSRFLVRFCLGFVGGQGQDTGSQLGGQVEEILLLHLGPAAGSGIPGQQALAVNAVGTKKLYLARMEQAGHGFGHPVVLPIVEAAAPGRQCQHRHAAVAVALKLHGAVQHRAPFLIINTIHTQTQ